MSRLFFSVIEKNIVIQFTRNFPEFHKLNIIFINSANNGFFNLFFIQEPANLGFITGCQIL